MWQQCWQMAQLMTCGMTVQDIDVAYMFDDMGNLDDDLSSLLVPDLDGTYGAGSSTSLAKSAADAMPTGMSLLYQLLVAAPMIGYFCTGHCTRATVIDGARKWQHITGICQA